MKLNLAIIRDHLGKEIRTKCYGHMVKTMHLDRPRLYMTGSKMLPGTLYITRAEALPQTPERENCCVICTDGPIPQRWLNSTASLLVVSGIHDPIVLFHLVQDVFDRFQNWELALTDELTKDTDFDIKQIIRLGVEVLNNPFAMMDATMQVIFSSDISETDGSLMIQVDDHPQSLGMESTMSIKHACNQERVIRIPYLSSVDLLGFRSYCYNLYPMGHFAGCAWVSNSHHKFQDSDFALADYFFPVFQKAYQKYMRNITDTEIPKVTALRKLLKHKPITAQEYELLKLEPEEHWVCFKLREKNLGHSMPKDYMYAALSSLLPGTVYVTFLSGSIVGLLKLQEDNEAMEIFRDLLLKMDYFCGVSNPFTDIQKLDDCYHQADFVVDIFSANSAENLLTFQDCLLPYMLRQCCGKLPFQDLQAQGIRTLQEYDARKGTDYLKTLDIYLRNEMSISRTSESLYIHRSSLIKRLDKINRITGFDLEDEDTRLYLRLYLRLM